jgi:hypothetical protein
VSVQIFVEGGGEKPTIRAMCRAGFSKYCEKLAPMHHRPSIVACGGRQQAFDRFKTAVQNGQTGEVFVLLVDSEGPVDAATPTKHLLACDAWIFPTSQNYEVFLMVQVMEAWFLADRETLVAFYNGGFLPNALPGSAANIEIIRKEDIASGLAKATRNTKTKGEYHKTKHGFDLLARIDPKKVESASPCAASFHKFLRERLL